jgi:hypothetical protein
MVALHGVQVVEVVDVPFRVDIVMFLSFGDTCASGFPENTQVLAGSNAAATRRGPYLCVNSHSLSRA